MDRSMVIASGWQFTGKSYYLPIIAAMPEMLGAVTIRMDAILRELYGDRPDTHITKTEHLFKNYATRFAMLRELVLGARTLLTETVLLTEDGHQLPMLEMVKEAREYVQSIEREYAERDHTPGLPIGQVSLRVILFHCSLECTERRIARAGGQARAFSPILNLVAMRGALTQFEYPRAYVPLIVDTSDESPSAERARLEEMQVFIAAGTLPLDNYARWVAVRRHREEIRTAIENAITS